MKKTNKKGFTLLEMLLAIAITMIIVGLFTTLLVAIRSSYYRAYNDDDCADIAQMYAQALENQVLYDCQNAVSDKIYMDHSTLKSDVGNFGFDSIPNFNNSDRVDEHGNPAPKWDIRMICNYNDHTSEFTYAFYFIDLYVQPGYVHYVYEGSFWLPNYMPYVAHHQGEGDEFTPSGTEVYGWDYNFDGSSAVTRPFSITIEHPATIDGDGHPVPDSPAGGTYYSRYNSDSMGNFGPDSSSDTVVVPANSSTVNITGSDSEEEGG
ncbi:MAG: prepilin-type N-terminal cleavage/methylation domain-containing protein [Saccharofermentans sp.]|nr:prepilin-type N-terminal cleavage/methylation domain-containing protein [Saccharofermentans sp.]